MSCSPANREEEENTEDDQIEYEDNEESVLFREEENTEDDQIEYEDNEESVSFYLPIEKKRTKKMTRLNMKTMKKVCPFHLLIEKKRTQKMTRLNTKTMKKFLSFSHADREEENTEDDQIEYEINEESAFQEMEDDIQALD